MAAFCQSKNFKGLAHWFTLQAGEEHSHAMKFFNYILERGAEVKLEKIEQPPAAYKTILAAFEAAYKHEQYITASINDIYALAISEKDYATQVFLQWFINEQVEEEANASEMVEHLKMAGDKPGTIMVIDHHAGKRGK